MEEKLVRNRIPEIISLKGQTPIVRTASAAEFRDLLRAKLQEEVGEFLAAPDIADPVTAFMELVDVLEVVRALAVDLGFDTEELNRARLAKAEMRGTFSGRVVWTGNGES